MISTNHRPLGLRWPILFGLGALLLVWGFLRPRNPQIVQVPDQTRMPSHPVKVVFEVPIEATLKKKPVALHTVEVLEDILRSKNDNDPRLDQEFNHLSSSEKVAMKQKYTQLRAESRNERGTIVFLLGRNMTSIEDFDFFRQVLEEPPCLSLNDCSQPPAVGSTGSTDASSQAEITLEYPQIIALQSLEKNFSENKENATGSFDKKKEVLQVLQEAAKSHIPAIRNMASTLTQRFSQ